jgi:hypothetical protein
MLQTYVLSDSDGVYLSCKWMSIMWIFDLSNNRGPLMSKDVDYGIKVHGSYRCYQSVTVRHRNTLTSLKAKNKREGKTVAATSEGLLFPC